MAGTEVYIDKEGDSEVKDFFEHVMRRTEEILSQSSFGSDDRNVSEVLTHVDLLERTVRLPDQLATIVTDETDVKQLDDLRLVFTELLEKFLQHFGNNTARPSSVTYLSCQSLKNERPGRPSINIPPEVLEDLRGIGFTWVKIARVFRVSRWTIMRRVRLFYLEHLSRFSTITDEEIDGIIRDFISSHGSTTGEPYLRGYFRAMGYTVQRRCIRESLNRVDPRNTALRWGALVSRRVYFVPWPNSLWHLDGHHSLIRWGFVIHGCIDGYSRRINFLHCSTNNLSSTVLSLFESAVEQDGGLWPSRIRVDFGVENTAVCDAMVAVRGEGRGSFTAGSSTRNQRIERLWRDVFRCICHVFYYTFYAMEQTGLLDVENPIHMFALQYVFLKRINFALSEWMVSFNDHPVQTEQNWSPNQMWLNGMMNSSNPLANGRLDDNPEEITFYGEDPEGQAPFEESDNNVEVSPAQLPNVSNGELTAYLCNSIDPLQESSSFGIDIYAETLRIIVQRLEEYNL
ncbi:uncharacterized protein [Montipora capricornis]|uniref:uncharacterized protein n=1 Tax=Montipora capricornis TaxID=246305 RepID=UPI0035F16F1F